MRASNGQTLTALFAGAALALSIAVPIMLVHVDRTDGGRATAPPARSPARDVRVPWLEAAPIRALTLPFAPTASALLPSAATVRRPPTPAFALQVPESSPRTRERPTPSAPADPPAAPRPSPSAPSPPPPAAAPPVAAAPIGETPAEAPPPPPLPPPPPRATGTIVIKVRVSQQSKPEPPLPLDGAVPAAVVSEAEAGVEAGMGTREETTAVDAAKPVESAADAVLGSPKTAVP